MNPANYTVLLNLVPPAIAISVLAYLTRFFGKIIADQQPFFDDRDWGVEIGGTTFMVNLSIGVIGIALALYWPISLTAQIGYESVSIVDLPEFLNPETTTIDSDLSSLRRTSSS